MSKELNKSEQIAELKKLFPQVERFYLDQDGFGHYVYTDGRDVNIGKLTGEQGKPGEPGPAVDIAEVIKEVLSQIPIPKDGADGKPGADGADGKPGEDGVSPNIDEIIQAVLEKIELPKDGTDGKDGADGVNGVDGVSPNIDEIIDTVRKLIPTPKDGEPGKDGAPGKDAPFSSHIQIIDIVETTNQDNSGKQIFEIPVTKLATITVDLIGAGATSFVSSKKSATFNKEQKIGEDQIDRATKTSNPGFGFTLIKTAGGAGVVITGPNNEEMSWAGSITINEIK
jgi:hypothetical protein